MGKRIALIIIVVAVAIILTGNSVGWIQRTELTRLEYFASFAQDYREQGQTDDGNTAIVVSAPDFSRLQKETERPLAQMDVNDLQVLVSTHPALQKDYIFEVEEVSAESVKDGFFRELALDYLYNTAENAKISNRWSDEITEADQAALSETIEVSAGTSKDIADQDTEEYLKWYRDGRAENLLLIPDNYSYEKVADALEPEAADTICYQPILELSGLSFSVEAEDYSEILMKEMVLTDLDVNKVDYASGLTFDLLQEYANAEFEKEVMRKAAVARLTSRSPGMEALKDDLNTVTTKIKNETDTGYQWAQCMAVFEVMAESYADFDNLLITISNNSDGALKEQADELRNAAQTAMKIRLSTYQGFQNATRSDYDVRWFDSIFFDAAMSSEAYQTDESFRQMIDEAQRLFGLVSIRWDLKKNVSAMTELPQADLESCLEATSDLIAQAHIDRIQEQAVATMVAQVQKEQAAGTLTEASADAYIAYSKYLLFGRMHGEYLLQGLVGTNNDMRDWFSKTTGEDVVSWYDAKSANLLNMRSDLLKQQETELATYQGHSYLCVDSGVTWEEAKAYCESMGGHLACINTEEEQNFITSVIKTGGKYQYWIGGYATADGYAWVTGEEFDYTNWDVNEPAGTGLTAGGTCLEILRTADPKQEGSKAFAWKLAPANNTYEVEKPEVIQKAEEAEAARKKAEEAGEQPPAQNTELTPEQKAAAEKEKKALEEAQKQYKEKQDEVGFYGTDHIGFICEWD